MLVYCSRRRNWKPFGHPEPHAHHQPSDEHFGAQQYQNSHFRPPITNLDITQRAYANHQLAILQSQPYGVKIMYNTNYWYAFMLIFIIISVFLLTARNVKVSIAGMAFSTLFVILPTIFFFTHLRDFEKQLTSLPTSQYNSPAFYTNMKNGQVRQENWQFGTTFFRMSQMAGAIQAS
jgi:hypothetical protein